MKRTSIHIKILTNFLILVTLTATSLIGIQYYFADKLAISAAQNSFSKVFDAISTQTAFDAKMSRTYLQLATGIEGIRQPISHEKRHSAVTRLIESLDLFPKAYATYITHQNGDLLKIVNLKHNPKLLKSFKAPEKSEWLIITVTSEDNHQTQQWTFLDKNLQILENHHDKNYFNPAATPWFKHALQSEKMVNTQPYLIHQLNAPGITFAKKIPDSYAVISLDFTLSRLQQMLREQLPTPDSDIFVFNKFGKIYFDANEILQEPSLWHQTEKMPLSQEEQNFISTHPLIHVSSQSDWAPFDYVEFGTAKGYSIDLLKLIGLKTGLKFNFVSGYEWYETVNAFKRGQLDMVQSIYRSEKREKFGLFSNPYYEVKHLFISRKDTPDIKKFNELKGKILAIPYGWKIADYLRQKYPNVIVQTFPDMVSALEAVSDNQAYATVDSITAAEFLIKQYKFNSLHLGNTLPDIAGINPQKLYFMVQPDMPALQSILNKALAHISTEEQSRLDTKWSMSKFNAQSAQVQANHTIPDQLMSQVKQGLSDNQPMRIDSENISYLTDFRQIWPDSDQSTMIGILAPRATLMQPYTDTIKMSLLAALLVILLVIPVVYFSTNLLVKPIKELMHLNDKIKQRDYDAVRETPTMISELHDLSASLVDMSSSIQSYQKSQAELLDAIIKLIANAIDAKSPYTGAHCKRVPEIAFMLLDAVNQDQSLSFKNYQLTDKDELRAFEIGAWLHDCGKVITPEYVVDKATKLETIYNRIHEIRTRFEVLWRDAEIDYYQALLDGNDQKSAEQKLHKRRSQLQEDFEFIALSNVGGEDMDQASLNRIEQIAEQTWQRHFDDRIGISQIESDRFKVPKPDLPATESLLKDAPEHLVQRNQFNFTEYQAQGFKEPVPEYLFNLGEVTNLKITRGTLTTEERFTIKEHVIHTIRMLNELPLPDTYKNVPEYAGTHHETLIGNGYPRQLKKEDLSIPERIMVIADIFEALTASDRPYKKGKTLSESLKILAYMREDQHIDGELFEVFLKSGVYLDYARKNLKPEQIDDVNIENYL